MVLEEQLVGQQQFDVTMDAVDVSVHSRIEDKERSMPHLQSNICKRYKVEFDPFSSQNRSDWRWARRHVLMDCLKRNQWELCANLDENQSTRMTRQIRSSDGKEKKRWLLMNNALVKQLIVFQLSHSVILSRFSFEELKKHRSQQERERLK